MQKTPDFLPEFRANLPRNSHVLSHPFSFTCTTAHLLPVFHTIANPGDTFNLAFNYNLRTQPLEAAAFGDIICHTEYFFVPIQMLYQPFDSVYFGTSDQFSSSFDPAVLNNHLPVFDFDHLVSFYYNNRNVAVALIPGTSTPVETVGQNAIRYFDMLGFVPTSIAAGSPNNYNPNVFPYQMLAYNCIYQYYYRLDTRENFDQRSFNLDKFYDRSSIPIQVSDYSPFLLHYRPIENDYFTDVKVSPIVDVLNLVDKNNLSAANDWLSQNSNIAAVADSLNPGIFSTFQQLLGGSAGNTGDPSYKSGTGSATAPDSEYHTRAYNTISGTVNSATGDLRSADTGYVIGSNSSGLQLRTPHTHSLNVGGSALNTANIRALFASEKLWQITGRAKKNYDDQTLAHFGFRVPHDVKHQITCFGHDTSMIHIGEVISTANTSLSPLGEIAGKGYCNQNAKIHKFTAPCHGVIMAIFSVVVKRNYEAGVLKANSVASREDFFIPEYDHLGMQPLFFYEAGYVDSVNYYQLANILGWQYRYEQWKRRFPRCTGVFRQNGGSLRGWLPTFTPYGTQSDIMGWSHGKTSNVANTPSYRNFMNYPLDVNQLFLVPYSNTWSSAYETADDWAHIYDFDPFIVNGDIDCVLVSSMSDYSLPRLDA